MKDGFIKVASGTPEVRVADCEYNKQSILELIKAANKKGVKILNLPELCITGYTCADLFLHNTLLIGAEKALEDILSETENFEMLFTVGLPVKYRNKLYNCAAVCNHGELLALVPKINIPNYGEFYEKRWFAKGTEGDMPFTFAGHETYLGTDVIFSCENMKGLCIGIEICEDLWATVPPSCDLAAAGATVILNPSASDEIACKGSYRKSLVASQSARLVCGYVYSDAGEGESSTDLVFSGHDIIAENGSLLAENIFETGLTISELDIDFLNYERSRITTFPDDSKHEFIDIPFTLELSQTKLTRNITDMPFVPSDFSERRSRCEEIFNISALGLKKRMKHTKISKLVVGISGGLDSTLAMLISARALDMLDLPRENLISITMPCFGTTKRTRSNAEMLADELHTTLKTVDITKSVKQHFEDIGHDENDFSVVFENSQARERTQVIMDIANGNGALVVGTGDMSELALGWATYNGDHMSMYGVNSGIPKTLVRYLVAYCAEVSKTETLSKVLKDILDTPVSPELLPSENGEISQKTEDLVGPYELHDFFLYHLIRRGDNPIKVIRLAEYSFKDKYDKDTILKWLRTFISRFFSQQFKRSCLPDGPKVGTLSLSPRGDWRMPSDAICDLWQKELKNL